MKMKAMSVLVLLVFCCPGIASACECTNRNVSLKEAYEKATAVFSAKVIRTGVEKEFMIMDSKWFGSRKRLKIRKGTAVEVRTQAIWKGSGREGVIIDIGRLSGKQCDLHLEAGEEYLLFTYFHVRLN